MTPGTYSSFRKQKDDQGLLSRLGLAKVGRFVTLLSFGVGFIAALVGLISAFQFRNSSFPGFFIEQTLVVSNLDGESWTGKDLGLNYPMRVLRLNGIAVENQSVFKRVLALTKIDSLISVDIITPNGRQESFAGIRMMEFPDRDFVRLFWLTYGVGMIYLLLGVWVYRVRGNTATGRAFAFFTTCAAVANLLLFDLWTSHNGTPLWTGAIALMGGAIIGLAVLVPDPIPYTIGRAWVRMVAYGISILLAIWGLSEIYDFGNPWDYVKAWQYSYLYCAIGLLIFIATTILRLRIDQPAATSQQIKIILAGGIISFTPIGVWFILQLFVDTPFDPLVLSPLLLIFPASIAIAILRYRMWDYHLVIRRTLIYSLLTMLLVTIYLIFVYGIGNYVSQWLNIGNFFNVLATLIIVSIFTPLRKMVQTSVDRVLYKEDPVSIEILSTFENKIHNEVEVSEVSNDLLDTVNRLVNPEFVSIWIPKNKTEKGGDHV